MKTEKELHIALISKIKDFVDSLDDTSTSPMIITGNEDEKAFAVLTDNGQGDYKKTFRITIELS